MSPDSASLDKLHDIVTPSPVSWWPPAQGWWIVGAVVAYLAAVGAIRALHAWQQARYRRDALRELRSIERTAATADKRPAAIRQLGELLKRTALSAWPRAQVASLSGPTWWSFLDRTGDIHAFVEADVGAAIEQATYDDHFSATVDGRKFTELAVTVENWIRRHRREAMR